MGKVVKKQGFLGLGPPLVKWFCDKCGVECRNQYSQGQLMFCRTCANQLDPEIVHVWPSDEIVRQFKLDQFFLDTSDGKERLIEHCNSCLGLLVVARSATEMQRLYYRVGSPTPSASTFPCIEHSGYDGSGEVRSQATCKHQFIQVGTSRRLDQEAHLKYEHMMSHRNRTIEQMFGTDDIDIQYHCFGTTHYWCVKCGLHHSLNPQRENLLPTTGRIGT